MSVGIITEYNLTGVCLINVDKLIKSWKENFRFQITKYKDTYRLVKVRKNSSSLLMKVEISQKQALEIIKKAGLVEIESAIFHNSSYFIRENNANNILQ